MQFLRDNENLARDSVFNIATLYGMNGLGFELRWGRDFPHPLTTHPSSAEVKETVEITFPPSFFSRRVIGRTHLFCLYE